MAYTQPEVTSVHSVVLTPLRLARHDSSGESNPSVTWHVCPD
jgi:hypothetical protein